jgi:hypothetical protein
LWYCVVDVPLPTPPPPVGVVLVELPVVAVFADDGAVAALPVTAKGPKKAVPSNGSVGGVQSPQ